MGRLLERTLSLLVMDRVTDAVPMLALCLLGTARFAGQSWSVVAMIALMLGTFALLLRPGWLALAIKLLYGRLRRTRRLFGRALRLVRALRALTAPAVLALALALGVLGWSAEIVGAWLVLDALGAQLGLFTTCFVFSFAMLVGALPLFPGGIGGAEGTMVGLLLVLDIDLGTAVTATAIIRLATLSVRGCTWLPCFAVGVEPVGPWPARDVAPRAHRRLAMKHRNRGRSLADRTDHHADR